MIIGIGFDVVELSRIKSAVLRNGRFVDRILTANEKQMYQRLNERRRIEFLAGRFAAKEAYAKARGTGIGTLSWHDIDVTSKNGQPVIESAGDETIHISITHTKSFAAAQVIIESPSG